MERNLAIKINLHKKHTPNSASSFRILVAISISPSASTFKEMIERAVKISSSIIVHFERHGVRYKCITNYLIQKCKLASIEKWI